MSAHLIADPTTTPRTLDPAAEAGWLSLSAGMTAAAADIANRDDLIVTAAPGLGHGSPACFLPAHAAIEINGVHLAPVDPASTRPHSPRDRIRYAPAWGLLTHECAHAQHTRWTTPPEHAGTATAEAATLLEESRIEAAQVRRRPDDRRWLRASARAIVLADAPTDPTGDPTADPGMSRWAAAHAAALLLARVDGGILDRRETTPLSRAVRRVLDASTLAKLRRVWRAAHKIGDHDAAGMLRLGRRWCDILSIDPDTPPPGATGTPGTAGTPGSPSTPPPPSAGRSGPVPPLTRGIRASLDRVAAAVAAEPPPADPAAEAADARAAEIAAAEAAEKAAREVFIPGGPRTGTTQTAGTRRPTPAEQAAARTLARALGTAGVRDRAAVKTASAVPPGRLRMRGALAADAQRAAGALPTAQPFSRTTRKVTPTPPLRVGIACDVSGSMQEFRRPVASAAWILAQAADLAPVPAETATVIFGHTVRPITYPGTAPNVVTEFDADDNFEDIPLAINALDHALGLSRPGAARLLVIISDGRYRRSPRISGQTGLDRLRAAGCALLWLTPDTPHAKPMTGATVHTLTDPAATAAAIGHAATTALRTTT